MDIRTIKQILKFTKKVLRKDRIQFFLYRRLFFLCFLYYGFIFLNRRLSGCPIDRQSFLV